MSTDTSAKKVGDEFALPWDLSEWIARSELRRWVAEEIDSLDWANPVITQHLRAYPSFQPKTLLKVLAYALATAVFDAEDVLHATRSDPDFKDLCGSWEPEFAKTFSRFRRENRGLLKWALVQVFKRALKARHGEFRLPAGVKRRLVQAARTRLDLARQLDRGHEGL